MFIAHRSGKHCSSTALSHAADFNKLLTLKIFDDITRIEAGHVKPVFMITVDGGPDENPRYEKAISVAIHHLIEHDMDVFFVATNAPGCSAYNRVERRMAPLSRELAGLMLPHEHFGSHLDVEGKTVDDALEKTNFDFAGCTLSEVWSGLTIDGYEVESEYIEPDSSEL